VGDFESLDAANRIGWSANRLLPTLVSRWMRVRYDGSGLEVIGGEILREMDESDMNH